MDPEVSPLIGETGLRRKGHIPLFTAFFSKAGAKVLLFFYMTKFFQKKTHNFYYLLYLTAKTKAFFK